MKYAFVVSLTVLTLTLTLTLTSASAQDHAPWPQWGGPERNFHTSSGGLSSSWPAGGPEAIWHRPLGEGYSALVADANALYTMYRDDEREIVVALDRATGETLWEHGYEAPLLEHMDYGTWLRQGGAGPYATPLLFGDAVYAIGTTGKLSALDRETGEVRWFHDLDETFSMRGYHGYASSPLAYEGNLIIPVGGRGQGVVAFDPKDGSVVWKNGDFALAPASPILIDVDGQEQLVLFTTEAVVGLDPRDGASLWSHPHPTSYGLNISTPVWGDGNLLFISSAYNGGSRVIRLTREGNATRVEELWESNRLRLHFGNAIRIGDRVIGTSGDFGPAFFIAVNVHTGEEVWRERSFGRSQMLYVDGKLIIVDETGDLAIASAEPDGLNVHTRAEVLTENAWTAPTLVGTTLYVRDRKHVIALELGRSSTD